MNDLHDLRLLLDSHVSLLVVESSEELRVVELFRRLSAHRDLYTWTVTDGLCREGRPMPQVVHAEPQALLREIKTARTAGIYLLLDMHAYFEDPIVVRLLKDIAWRHDQVPHTVVLVSHAVTVPGELKALTARFELSLPGPQAIEQIVREEARDWTAANNRTKVRSDPEALRKLVRNLVGLTAADARRLARAAIFDDGAITADDLPAVMKAKQTLLDSAGAISFELETAGFADIGGLAALKLWLERRRDAFFQPTDELDQPRGILLVGVQGAGKSLAAKATAGAWGLPLLRLDFGTLYNRYFGQTEQNLRTALATASVMAPCVLWVDEIEKAIAEGNNDQGVSQRLLGHLLTWMSEREAPVFLVATANNIDRLPPELIRKGRLDEVFFVDLPSAEVRAEILRIHLQQRNLGPSEFDVERLAQHTQGFSGAELEQGIVSARYLARERGEALTTEHVLEELSRTRPLSVVMAERIAALRAWAADRTVSAD